MTLTLLRKKYLNSRKKKLVLLSEISQNNLSINVEVLMSFGNRGSRQKSK